MSKKTYPSEPRTPEKRRPARRLPSRYEPEPPPVFLDEILLRERYKETLTDLLVELKKDPGALEVLQEVYPDILDDLAEKGLKCVEFNQFPHSEKIFQYILEQHEIALAHAAYADSLFGLGRYFEARYHYAQTIALAPAIPDAYHSLAETHMILEQPERAIERLEQMLALDGIDDHPLKESAQKHLEYARQAKENAGS